MFRYLQYYLKGIKTEYIAIQPPAYVNRNENCHNYILESHADFIALFPSRSIRQMFAIFPELNSQDHKDCIEVHEKKKKVVVLC